MIHVTVMHKRCFKRVGVREVSRTSKSDVNDQKYKNRRGNGKETFPVPCLS